MVTYILIFMDDVFIDYEYYPEGKKEKEPGLIRIDKRNETIDIIKVAEDDFNICIPASEFAKARDSMNRSREERGLPELTEEELPIITKDQSYYQYAEHVINKIIEDYQKEIIREKGTIIWY